MATSESFPIMLLFGSACSMSRQSLAKRSWLGIKYPATFQNNTDSDVLFSELTEG